MSHPRNSQKQPLTAHCCRDDKPVSHAQQSFIHIVDCQATRKPQALFAEYPVSATSYDAGFRKITYRDLANAVNGIAWWLKANLGIGSNFDTLAYIGPNDLRYPALILGSLKAGYKTLLLSPRNSIEAQLHLLQTTNCKIFIVPEPCPPPVKAVLNAIDSSYRVLTIPAVDELLQRSAPFVYDVPYEAGKQSPFVILHSSGSTGLPKPLTLLQSFIAAFAKQLQLLPPEGFESTDKLYQANRLLVLAPPFHGAYVAQFINAVINQTALILPIQSAIPTIDSVAAAMKHTRIDVAAVVPQMLEELSRSPELLDTLAPSIDAFVYAGGDLPQKCGDIISARIPVINVWGSTETGSLGLIHSESGRDPKDWKYLAFHPNAGAEFRHYAEDKYEMFIVRQPELEAYQPVFITFPDLQEYRTRDLFRRHPQKPYLWSHCGRADDMVVLVTGEKIAPVDMEQYILASNPEISGVLIAGAQRFQPALLIELSARQSQASTENLVEMFWPSIEVANESLPKHAQLVKSHILFTDPKRPMVRSPKGSVQRNATLSEYAEDLDVLYEQADKGIHADASTKLCDLHDTEPVLKYFESAVTKLTGQHLDPKDNFFVHGMDSLQALLLTREIKRNIGSVPPFDVRFMYMHPTQGGLLDALQNLAKDNTRSDQVNGYASSEHVSTTLAGYEKALAQISRHEPTASDVKRPAVYLLTGSTGSLGSYLLDALTKSDAAHIYCLNRSTDSASVQKERNAARGLDTKLSKDRITFLTVDLQLPSFGLDPELYSRLANSVTHIIHNAWTVNFNVPLPLYHQQIQGLIELVGFANAARYRPSILYTSSISAIPSTVSGPVGETVIEQSPTTIWTGYGASKYVAEHLLQRAAVGLGLDIKIARLGQIAGPVDGRGAWNRSEWLPSMVRSSADLGILPASLGPEMDRIDWIPIDTVAGVLFELVTKDEDDRKDSQRNSNSGSTSSHTANFEVFNIVNPNTTQWADLVPAVISALSSRATHEGKASNQEDIKVVSPQEWIQKVRAGFEARQEPPQSNGQGESAIKAIEAALESNPAAKLLDFYQGAFEMAPRVWETSNAQKASSALDAVGPIRGVWLERWMQHWL